MSSLVRSAKSGNDWTRAELDAYNISIVSQDSPTFFGVSVLPQPAVDQETLEVQDADHMSADKNAQLINLLDLAMSPAQEESAVVDFAVELLRRLGYVRRHRVARTHKDIPLLICGKWKPSKTDVCIIDRSRNGDVSLLVQEDKRFGRGGTADMEAEAQLIAEAIAAFSYNNFIREEAGLPAHISKVIPGIVMFGTFPTFYKINVTSELEYSVRHGLYPPTTTQVFRHQPIVPRPNRGRNEGMRPLDARKEILKCYEAFKAIVGI